MGFLKRFIFWVMLFYLSAFNLIADQSDSLKQEISKLKNEVEDLKIEMEILKSNSEELTGKKPYSIYGYWGLRFHNMNWTNGNVIQAHLFKDPTFSQTNLNIYFQFNPIENVQMLSEIRFLYDPKGIEYEKFSDISPNTSTMDTILVNVPGTPYFIPVPAVMGSNGVKVPAVLTNSGNFPIDADGNPIQITPEMLQAMAQGHFEEYLAKLLFKTNPTFKEYWLMWGTLPTYFVDYTNAINYDWGGIKIERAQVDLKYRDFFNLKLGKFFTPFGIWNVDHGLPVLLTARVPIFLAFVPESQTGIQMYGDIFFPHSTLNYALYFSNGKGPRAEIKDNNKDKAFGGRLALNLQLPTFKELSLGVSFFRGGYTINQDTLKITYDPTKGAFVTKPYYGTAVEYKENTLGVDFKGLYRNFILQTEFLYRTHKYDKFQPHNEGELFKIHQLPDVTAFYVQTGYTLPFRPKDIGITPYARYEKVDGFVRGAGEEPVASSGDAQNKEKFNVISVGLNIRQNPYVVYTIDYTSTKFEYMNMKFKMLTAAIAVSF